MHGRIMQINADTQVLLSKTKSPVFSMVKTLG